MNNMETKYTLLDCVKLLRDVPEHNLQKGEIGTIVEILELNIYDIEFADNEGQTIAFIPLHAKEIEHA